MASICSATWRRFLVALAAASLLLLLQQLLTVWRVLAWPGKMVMVTAFFLLVFFFSTGWLRDLFFRSREIPASILAFISICWLALNGFLVVPAFLSLKAIPQHRLVAAALSPGNWHGLLQQYEKYFNDRFPGRETLIHWNNLSRVYLWRISPLAKVLIGQQHWLFLSREESNRDESQDFRRTEPLSWQKLHQWKSLLEQRYQWLAERNIRYLFIVAPNKSTIYPEFMPKNLRRFDRPSQLDQLLAYLRSSTRIPVLDLRPALWAAKALGRVYYISDSHWNDFGAYVGYREIVSALRRDFSRLRPFPLRCFAMRREAFPGGDLADLLTLPASFARERHVRFLLRSEDRCRGQRTDVERRELPRAMMVHDSFALKWKPWLSYHFSSLTFIWDWGLNFFSEEIRRKKIQLVIDEVGERFLDNLNVVNPDELQHVPVEKFHDY